MLMRTIAGAVLVSALAAGTAAAQAPASGAQTTSSETRPGLPTNFGDSGLWFVPTADVLPASKWSGSLYRANFDRRQGLTDVSHLGITGAYGIGDRLEVFGSWRLVRLDRAVRNPLFVSSDPLFGGVAQEYPNLRRGWSETLGGPVAVGAKYALISQSRGDAMSLAPRVVLEFPTGSPWASTNDLTGHLDLVASREFSNSVELTGVAGAVLRGDPDQFQVSDGVNWGLGATFPTRSRLRALVEWQGEFVIKDNVVANTPLIAEDGSIAPTLSRIQDPTSLKFGGVWQDSRGWFLHAGASYSAGAGDRTVGGQAITHRPWGFDIRLGYHPGVRKYVPPPPPAPVVREVVREVPAPAPPPPPPPNRNPQFAGGVNCDPCILEPGQTSRLSATATDPDGDPVTFRWTTPQGTFSTSSAQNTVWTAPNTPGNVPVTVTAEDNRGGSATSSVTLQVVRRTQLVFEDVHFDFDKFSLRPDALQILDDATMKLMSNPDVRITIEGHCDSLGTVEYNLALGERRANAVRDYLANRGVANGRLRAVSYGEERPKADNNTAEGRAMNRRGALVVTIEQP